MEDTKPGVTFWFMLRESEKKVVVSSYTQPSKHDNLKIELEVSEEKSKRKNLKGKILKRERQLRKGSTKELPKKEIIYHWNGNYETVMMT